ncbi:MAG: Ig-like domain repeat protein [Terriglobales bacterium]
MKTARTLSIILLLTASSLSMAKGTPTQTVLSSSLNPSIYGQAVTFTVVVTPAPPNGETVTFLKGSTTWGTGTLSGGSASFSTSTLPAGTLSMKATYSGDSTYASSTSNVVSQVVDQASTTTGLVSSPNPSNSGQNVTFTASVAPQYSGTVTGMVAFFYGSTKKATVALSGGVATYTTANLPIGTDTITATFNGSTSFTSSTSAPVNQKVGGGTFIDSTMTWDGVTRYYEVYLPSNLPANPPMLLMLHGTRTTSTEDSQAVISLNWGWQPVADQYGFILVKPASTYDANSHQWNWNAYCMDGTALCAPNGANGGAFAYAEGCESADSECPDDAGFLRALIGVLTSQYGVNPKMVYVSGFSSGAEMTERVGVELSDIVAAIVPASGQLNAAQGTVPPPLPLPQAAKAHISVQEWHGTLDQELPPCDYGTTLYSGVTFTLDSADDTFGYWTGSLGDDFTDENAVFQTTATLCTPTESTSGVPNNANDAPTPPYPVIPVMPRTLSGNIAVSTVPPSGEWPSAPITAASESGTTVTITSTLNPGVAGVAIITGMTPPEYNGTWLVTMSTPTTFQYTNTASGLGAGTEFGRAAGGQNTEVQFIWEPGIAHSYQNQYDVARWYFFATHPKP